MSMNVDMGFMRFLLSVSWVSSWLPLPYMM